MESEPISENLKVYVRVRPFLDRELKAGNSFPVMDVQSSGDELHAYEFMSTDLDSEEKVREMLQNPRHFQVHIHHYDHVFSDSSSQEEVYKLTALNCLDYLLKGFNSTIIAYGQTGTGKTFTMEGDFKSKRNRGIIPRMLQDLFLKTDAVKDISVTASFVQIYNETLSDLLNPDNKSNLQIREDKVSEIHVEGLTEVQLSNAKQALEYLEKGSETRVSASTKMNNLSSRSHAIFIIRIVRNLRSGDKLSGKLNLVDLAGSERISFTGAKGKRLEECKKINLSLAELSNVIASLTKKNSSHIPYRNSKLTRLLEDSLGGNAFTSFIATVSPAHDWFNETISTLKFASRAKNIKNFVSQNKQKAKVQPMNIYQKYNEKMLLFEKRERELEGLNGRPEALKFEDFDDGSFNEEELKGNELEKYKELLMQQRDIVIKITNKLNDKDEVITTLRQELKDIQNENQCLNIENNHLASKNDPTDEISNELKLEIGNIKYEVDGVIFSLTQQNDSLDLQNIATSILNVQKILEKLSKYM